MSHKRLGEMDKLGFTKLWQQQKVNSRMMITQKYYFSVFARKSTDSNTNRHTANLSNNYYD